MSTKPATAAEAEQLANAQNRVAEAVDYGKKLELDTVQQISAIEDTDLTDAILEMTQAQTAQKAALQADAKQLASDAAPVVKQAADDPNDLAGYADALADTLNDLLKQQLGKGWDDLSSPAEVLGFFAWLQRYKDTDFEQLADDVYTGVELQEETPEQTKQLLREFLDEAFKNILAAARSSKKAAELWSGIVHKMLDKLLCDDFFGTEGQRDPRGDRRG